MIKIGVADYGMDVWHGGCYDITERLEALRSIGLDGTEWLKAVDAADAVYKAASYREMGMDFASCSIAASQELGMTVTAALGKEYVWLLPGAATRDVDFEVYCRRANGFVKAAARFGLKAALHNHIGTRVESQKELEDFMQAVPGAHLLLDIGHLAAAGGDNVAIVEKYCNRLASVHFKDVYVMDESIGFDEWWKRLRFCELGGGNIGVDYAEKANQLIRSGYDDKWIFIEHDTHLREPLEDLKVSSEILRNIFIS